MQFLAGTLLEHDPPMLTTKSRSVRHRDLASVEGFVRSKLCDPSRRHSDWISTREIRETSVPPTYVAVESSPNPSPMSRRHTLPCVGRTSVGKTSTANLLAYMVKNHVSSHGFRQVKSSATFETYSPVRHERAEASILLATPTIQRFPFFSTEHIPAGK